MFFFRENPNERDPPINLDAQIFLIRKFWIRIDPPTLFGGKFRKKPEYFIKIKSIFYDKIVVEVFIERAHIS